MKYYTKYKCTKDFIKTNLKKITKYIEILFQLRKEDDKNKDLKNIHHTH